MISMEPINLPTGLLVEVQVNWPSPGELVIYMLFVSSLRFNEFQKLSFTINISGVYSGSGHGTTAARDRGAFFFWPPSGLHIIVSLSLASAASMGNSRLDSNTRLAFGFPCYFQFLCL